MLPTLGKHTCKYCKAPVASHLVNMHCGSMSCKFKFMDEKKQESKAHWQRRKTQHQEKINTYTKRVSELKDVNVDEISSVSIPSCQYELSTIEEARRQDFLQHITHCLQTLDTEQDDRAFNAPYITKVPTSLSTIVGQACATCRGKCCNQGYNFHAFIRRVTLKRVLENVDDVNTENLVDLYAQYIPDHSFENSCIYHAEQGCTLREDLRADICGDFFCLQTSNYIAEQREKSPAKYHVFFAEKNCDVDAVRVVDDRGDVQVIK